MFTMNNINDLLRKYFSSKTQKLLAEASEAICEHSSLKGSHREDIIKLYLNDIIPKRFGIGKGMVYGSFHKSKEADIVIWDAYNYPQIQMQGHSLFFAESVKLVIEVKSNFNQDVLNDILVKSNSVRNIVTNVGLNLADEITMIQQQIQSIATGEGFDGLLKAPHHIATAAIVFNGGREFRLSNILLDKIVEADDLWPDLLLLLGAGKLVVKSFDDDEGCGYLEMYEANEDALLLFTKSLLEKLSNRIVNIEEPFYFSHYIWETLDKMEATERIKFRLTRPMPGRQII